MRTFRRFRVGIGVLLMLTGACVRVQAQTDAEKAGSASAANVGDATALMARANSKEPAGSRRYECF